MLPDPNLRILILRDHEDLCWFAADRVVVTVGPFRLKGRLIRLGEELLARYWILVHDDDAMAARIAAWPNK